MSPKVLLGMCSIIWWLVVVAQKPTKRNGEKDKSEPENKRSCLDSEGTHFYQVVINMRGLC